MKRLTSRCTDGRATPNKHLCAATDLEILDRLAAIEDILGDEYDLDHLRDLVQAEQDGRLVVLPPEDYIFQIRGDIALGIIEANCRAARKEAEAALKEGDEG